MALSGSQKSGFGVLGFGGIGARVFVAKSVTVVVAPDVPGLDYTMPGNKLEYTMDSNKLDYTKGEP